MTRRASLGLFCYQLANTSSFLVSDYRINQSKPLKSNLIPSHRNQLLSITAPLRYKEGQEESDDFSSSESGVANKDQQLPSCIQSPVLKQVYPALLEHISQFGNPNIPLGNSNGKKCKVLRRLAFQKVLTEEEIDLLTSLGFRFNSLEDVYEEADFDECLGRLLA